MTPRSLVGGIAVAVSLVCTGCQSPVYAPTLVGEDIFRVGFHGQISTERTPLVPSKALQADFEPAPSPESTPEIDVDVHVLTVKRDRLRSFLAVKYDGRENPADKLDRGPGEVPVLGAIPILSFFFKDRAAVRLQAWLPRGMRVPAEQARRAISQLQLGEHTQDLPDVEVAPTLRFRCRAGECARLSNINRRSFVDRFEFTDDDDTLQWEPIIDVVDSGIALAFRPTLTDGRVRVEMEMKIRAIQSMPTANSRITGAYQPAFGSPQPARSVTIQAPVCSDQVLSLDREFNENDAFLLFTTSAVREDEVLLALFEVNRVDQ